MRCLFFGCLIALGCSSAVNNPAPAEPPADLRTRKTGSDWPRFLGPTQNGVSPEKGIITQWPKEGLKLVWEVQLGEGYVPPVISNGRLFHFDRFGDKARLTCRNAETGKLLWKFEYPTNYEDLYNYSPGPRATPLVDDDRVYVYGVEGMLYCLHVADGKELWKVDTRAKYHFQQNFFGVGSSPVVEGDLLIVPIGGSPKGPRPVDFRTVKGNGTGIVAFDKRTGEEKYRITDELASYSCPVLATINGRRWCFYFARGGLVGFEPASGKVDFHYRWRSKLEESVNASCPVVVGDKVLITECYGPGAALLRVKPGGYEVLWTDADKDARDRSLRCHWNTPVYHDGYVYGSSGRHEDEAELRCVKLDTGEVKWSKKGLGRTSLTMIDGHFLCLSERGELLLLKVNPEKYDAIARWEVEGLDYPSWAAPVVAQGLLYLRGKDRLACFELIPEKK